MQRKKELGLTVSDPEFPNDPEELLYFVLVELDIENIAELKRVTKLEMEGGLDADCLKAFVEAGGSLNGDQRLQIGNLMDQSGKKKLVSAMGVPKTPKKPKTPKGKEGEGESPEGPHKMTEQSPLQKAIALQNQVLSKANSCRDHAFKLGPLAMSEGLIGQLNALDVQLQGCAKKLQGLIRANKDKNHKRVAVIQEVNEATALATERLELARALIRASEKNSKPKPKAKSRAKKE
ncbi:Uncharacterized protein SCF082_LOCUS13410 [Durusdinium trenchii]|uniref:Uncharacterized protein n=1 Tax=Durusdinium trenchii TaxID=1381693 RepID=A0ABP0JR49_9DINO